MIREHRRVAYLLVAPAVCLALFWRAPFIWFRNDDFAWLGLPLEVHNFRDLLHVLFVPRAQGTVRVLSERLFFLIFASAFDVNALPFRICALLTWFADLTLATLIGARLLRSWAAGVLAAVLWTASGAIVLPLVWASTYNEVLCTLFILMAFYARLRYLESGGRGWKIAEWAAYLAGFGALEIVVMYPFIVVLHAFCMRRQGTHQNMLFSDKNIAFFDQKATFFDTVQSTAGDQRSSGDQPPPSPWLGTFSLFVPAVIFTAVHFFLIPKTQVPYYSLTIDHRLPATFLQYLSWALAPSLIRVTPDGWRSLGVIFAPVTVLVLLGVAVWRARHRDFTALFCWGWFVLLILPVLPLPEHLSAYYLTVPVLGLAWLAGWAIVSAWRATGIGGALMRATSVLLAATYLIGSIHEIDFDTNWNYDRSERMRMVFQAVDEAERYHPGSAILLSGVDEDLFESGFQDYPFRLGGAQNVYLAPGDEDKLASRLDLGGLAHFIITPPKALDLIARGKARVLAISGDQVADSTRAYADVLRARLQPRGNFVDVGDPNYAAQLGDTWFPPEGGARWMRESATVKLSGIDPSAQKFYVTGYAPAALIASGPITLIFRGNGQEIGSAVMEKPDDRFSLAFSLPPALVGQSSVEISIHASKTLRFPGDERDLSMIFGTFSIR
jgi:hypothetical protein